VLVVQRRVVLGNSVSRGLRVAMQDLWAIPVVLSGMRYNSRLCVTVQLTQRRHDTLDSWIAG
jgi:hypothetical protein